MTSEAKPYGMIAEFRTAASVLHAAEKVRNAGFRKWDVFSPFPVHGMDKAMGLTACSCGGRFRRGSSPRCPACAQPLSADSAAVWIEANAPGTAKGWKQ